MVSKIKMKLWNSFIYDVGKKVSQKPEINLQNDIILRNYSSTFRHQNASSPCLNQSISWIFFHHSISMSTNHLFWSPILNDRPDAGNKFPWITITYNSGRSVTRQLGRTPMIFCQFEPNSCENIRWFQSHFRFGHNTTKAIVIATVP